VVDTVDWEDPSVNDRSRRRGQRARDYYERRYPDRRAGRYRPRESSPRYRRRGDRMPPTPRDRFRDMPDSASIERDYHGFTTARRRRSYDAYYADSPEVVLVDEGEYEEYYDYDEVLAKERKRKRGLWDYEEVPPSYEDEDYEDEDDGEPRITRKFEVGEGRRKRFGQPLALGDRYDEYDTRSFWDQMGFYNLFWDPRYNVKIPVMQIIAIVSLVIIFILNYRINIEFVEMLGSFSIYVAFQPPELAWVFALMLALFLSVIPSMDREFRLQITLWVIIIIIIFFIAYPAITFFATYNMLEVGRALASSLIEFLKIVVVLVYWAPILFAVYGIFNRERFYIFTAVLFFLGVIIVTDLALMVNGIPHDKDAGQIPLFTTFALALFCFYEMSDSSITFFQLNESPQTWDHDSMHQLHLDRILQKYFLFFIIFSALALVLTVPILSFNEVLSALGSRQVGESIELNSIYGTIVSLFVIVIFLIFIGYLIRYEYDIKSLAAKAYDKYFSTRVARRRSREVFELDEDDEDTPAPVPDVAWSES
jgi:heme/copper-type cytochrome/quinol oxidase subunit 2